MPFLKRYIFKRKTLLPRQRGRPRRQVALKRLSSSPELPAYSIAPCPGVTAAPGQAGGPAALQPGEQPPAPRQSARPQSPFVQGVVHTQGTSLVSVACMATMVAAWGLGVQDSSLGASPETVGRPTPRSSQKSTLDMQLEAPGAAPASRGSASSMAQQPRQQAAELKPHGARLHSQATER